MNVTKDSLADKSLRQIMEQAESLRRFVVEAVVAGNSLHEIERGVLEQVLIMGRHAIDATLRLHWDEFQAQRREQEVRAFHPHRAALQDYQPRVAL